MSLALTDEHRALAQVVRDVVGRLAAADVGTADQGDDRAPTVPIEAVELGWMGLAIPEDLGGQGYGLLELGVLAFELGAALAAPAVVPAAVGATVLAAGAERSAVGELVRSVVAGERQVTVAPLGRAEVVGGTIVASVPSVPCAAGADMVLVRLGRHDVVVVDLRHSAVEVVPEDGLDLSRPTATLLVAGVPIERVTILPSTALLFERTVATVLAAEGAGVAASCTRMSVEYASTRVQFGRVIGTFQAVKHLCADMFVDAELAAAAAWGAARSDVATSGGGYAAAVAAAVSGSASVRCAERMIQVHGGIGYTWEHRAHRYLRRAMQLDAWLGRRHERDRAVADLARRGVRHPVRTVLPDHAAALRADALRVRADVEALEPGRRRAALAASGYLAPHLPPPYGRAASPLEQLVIEDVLGDLEERDLGIGMWILPTILQHGTPEQIEAWVGPSLQGVLRWCQLFSEPDAGSDAAAVRTRGTRVEGGWRVTGQKIWTSDAQHCTLGLATVRTDPEAPKHRGITAMVVDLAAAGVEVRPLRDMTGAEIFNEVFLDDVLVPDDHVIGAPGEGWTVARSTLSNERLTIGRGVRMPGLRAADVLERVEDGSRDPVLLADAGRLLAREEALTLLNEQLVALALSGGDIGARGSLSKLVGAELAQQVADLVRVVTGVELVSGRAQALAREVLFTRCLTIAGGTSEITRNQIGERLLGLPRDPLLT